MSKSKDQKRLEIQLKIHKEMVMTLAEEIPPAKTFVEASTFYINQTMMQLCQQLHPEKEVLWGMFFATLKVHGYVIENVEGEMMWLVK